MVFHLLKKEIKVTEQFLRKFHLTPQTANLDLKMDLNQSKTTISKIQTNCPRISTYFIMSSNLRQIHQAVSEKMPLSDGGQTDRRMTDADPRHKQNSDMLILF